MKSTNMLRLNGIKWWRRCRCTSFFIVVSVMFVLLSGCAPEGGGPVAGPEGGRNLLGGYPDFITANEDYFTTRISGVPEVNPYDFGLEITGLVDTPRSYSLQELMNLPLVSMPLTVECIGNGTNGDLVGTAVWKGFRLYDLLASLGLDSTATGVKYRCADGYYASNTMEQVKNNDVIGALFMNDDTIPPLQGFPIRMLSPGYYGVKQPMWVVGIEVSGQPLSDYWGDRGWDVSKPMLVNSTIFFPEPGSAVTVGDTLRIGGAAYGGTRVASVAISPDNGTTWVDAEIVKSLDVDNVWVFWEAEYIPVKTGQITISARATDIHGETQPQIDTDYSDGSNDWPATEVTVIGGL